MPAVHDDAHAGDGQAGLGDVGGEHDAAPTLGRRRQRRAAVYLNQGKAELALADASTFLGLQPDNFEAYRSRASIYHRLGRYAEEIADDTAALSRWPESDGLLLERAYARAWRGDFDGAEADLAQARKRLSGLQLAEASAWVAWLAHKPDQAQAFFNQALAQAQPPDDSVFRQPDPLTWLPEFAAEIPRLLQTLPVTPSQEFAADLELVGFGDRAALARVYAQIVELQRTWLKQPAPQKSP